LWSRHRGRVTKAGAEKLDARIMALYHLRSETGWRRQPPPCLESGCETNSEHCMKAKATAEEEEGKSGGWRTGEP